MRRGLGRGWTEPQNDCMWASAQLAGGINPRCNDKKPVGSEGGQPRFDLLCVDKFLRQLSYKSENLPN